MCVEISNKISEITDKKSNQKISYTLKKMMKQIFKQQKAAEKLLTKQNVKSMNSWEESLENSRNASIEDDLASVESYENDINERLSVEATTYVPVHFIRTEHGTFFWTAGNAALPIIKYNQMSCMDRWAQA